MDKATHTMKTGPFLKSLNEPQFLDHSPAAQTDFGARILQPVGSPWALKTAQAQKNWIYFVTTTLLRADGHTTGETAARLAMATMAARLAVGRPKVGIATESSAPLTDGLEVLSPRRRNPPTCFSPMP